MEPVSRVFGTWTSLFQEALGVWVDQIQTIQGGLGVVVLLATVFFSKKLAALLQNVVEGNVPRKSAAAILMVWFGWVFMMTTHNRIAAIPPAPQPPSYPVENSDHERQLLQLETIKSENSAFKDTIKELERKLDDAQKELKTATGQLNDSARRKVTIKMLEGFNVEATSVRSKCRELLPAAFNVEANRVFVGAIDYLRAAGLTNDAQNLKNLTAPLGMPRLVSPVCEPNSDNSKSAFALVVMNYILNDVISRLSK